GPGPIHDARPRSRVRRPDRHRSASEYLRRARLTGPFDHCRRLAAVAMAVTAPGFRHRPPPVPEGPGDAPQWTSTEARAWLDADRANLVAAATPHRASPPSPARVVRPAPPPAGCRPADANPNRRKTGSGSKCTRWLRSATPACPHG